jgi:hypothetical protein
MVRCKEFYEKWERCGNFCEKHKDTAERIDKYLDLIEEAEAMLNSKDGETMGRISERALRPLIAEKDPEIRADAIKQCGELKTRKERRYGKDSGKSRVTGQEVKRIISERKKEKAIQNGIVNEEKSEFDFNYEFTNLWNFNRCDPNFGIESYPGRMPAQIIINLLHFYTEKEDLVIDPMSGGGTTLDVCKAMNRKCLAYDINPCRSDIIKNDIITGIPSKERAKLIILDPPYSIQKKGEYTSEKTDLSNLTISEFYSAIDRIAKDSKEILLKDGYVAFIISSLKKDSKLEDLSFRCYKIFIDNNFIIDERIVVPYVNASSNTGYWIESARKNKFMLRIYRDLMIFRLGNKNDI